MHFRAGGRGQAGTFVYGRFFRPGVLRPYLKVRVYVVALPAQERLIRRCRVLAGLRERFGGEERVRCGDGIERVVREREGQDAGVDEGVVAGLDSVLMFNIFALGLKH